MALRLLGEVVVGFLATAPSLLWVAAVNEGSCFCDSRLERFVQMKAAAAVARFARGHYARYASSRAACFSRRQSTPSIPDPGGLALRDLRVWRA